MKRALALLLLALPLFAATKTLTGKHYTLTYDAAKWTPGDTSKNAAVEHLLAHKSGKVHATTVAEERPMALGALRQLVLENARNAAPDIRVVSETHRTVHGADMLVLRMEGIASGIPITYYGEYWSGPAGTLQVVTFTQTKLFNRYKADMKALLDGVRVKP
jgi:hypothetical protein